MLASKVALLFFVVFLAMFVVCFFIAVFQFFCAISKFLYTHSPSFPLHSLKKINEGGDEKQKIKLVWPNTYMDSLKDGSSVPTGDTSAGRWGLAI